jgi:hypothetical protein
VPIDFCDGDPLVAPSVLFLSALAGLRCLFIVIQGLRASRLPLATFSPRRWRYLLAAPLALPSRRASGATFSLRLQRYLLAAPPARFFRLLHYDVLPHGETGKVTNLF